MESESTITSNFINTTKNLSPIVYNLDSTNEDFQDPYYNQTEDTLSMNNQTDARLSELNFRSSLSNDNNSFLTTSENFLEKELMNQTILDQNSTQEILSDYDAKQILTVQENAIFISCVYDPLLIDMRFSFKFSYNDHPNKCFDECFQRGYQYAATRKLNSLENLCFCDNRYGTYQNDTITKVSSCACRCGLSRIISCGCENFNRVVKVKNRLINTELVGYSLGCYKTNLNLNFDFYNTQQDICSEICFRINERYFSAINFWDDCFCGNLISKSKRVNDFYCDIKFFSYFNYNKLTQIIARSLQIECPKAVFINKSFNCTLYVTTDIKSYQILVDFGFENYKMILNGSGEFKAKFNFNYTVKGTYNIRISLSNHKMNVDNLIYVYDTNHTHLASSHQKKNFSNGIYNFLGCFLDRYYFSEFNTELLSKKSSNMTPEYCISYCEKNNFLYAILKSHFWCFCSNKYGMNGLTQSGCNCLCSGSSDKYCGCINHYFAYRLKNKRSDITIVSTYLGCFTTNIFPSGKHIPYNTNGICLNFCSQSKYLITYESEYCYCLETIDQFIETSENMCNFPCAGNSSQICGGYEHGSLFKISNISLDVSLPYYVKAEKDFNFKLILQSNNNISNKYLVDFGDGDIRNFSFVNSSLSLEKNYNLTGLYEIRVIFLRNNLLLLNPLIFVDEPIFEYSIEQFNLSLYEKTVMKLEINENSEYLGCFSKKSIERNISKTTLDNSKCSIFCSKQFHTYSDAHTAGYCFCSKDYETPTVESLSKCLCACPNKLNRFCSCFDEARIYHDTDSYAQILIGKYIGCFETTNILNDPNVTTINFGFLSNDICIQYCNQRNYLYASTTRGDECQCFNETFDLNILNETYCNQKCSGNYSQICGDISSKSVYFINTLSLQFECSFLVRQYEEFSCFLTLKSNVLELYKILVDFEDGDLRSFENLNFIDQVLLTINKTYNTVGNFTVKAYLVGTTMNVNTKVNVKFEFKKNDPDTYGYIGCYFDRNPLEFNEITFVSEYNMTNLECMNICYLYGYDFSATFYGNSCSCANIYGSYNLARNGLICDQVCSGNGNEICGGKTFNFHSIYDTDSNSLTFGLNMKCTTVNVSNLTRIFSTNSLIDTCQLNRYPFLIASDDRFYCSNENYLTFGIDHTNSLCDKVCPLLKECGGSQYRLNSVYDTRVLINKTKNTNEYYYEYLGCFRIQKPTYYINFKNLTLSKCIKFCNYFNSSIAGSGLQCICLNEQQVLKKVPDTYCQDLNSSDWHFSGKEEYYGVYSLKILNRSEIVPQKNEYTFLGKYSVFFHQLILELKQNTKEECQNFCKFYNFIIFGIRGYYCYCGNNLKISPGLTLSIEIYISFDETETTSNYEYPSTQNAHPTTQKVDLSTQKAHPTAQKVNISTQKVDLSTYKIDLTTSKLNNLTVISEPLTLFQSLNDLTLTNAKFILDILNDPTQDLTGCLTNCSNNGWCGKIEKKIKCKCFNEYEGSNCAETTNICKKEKRCLNNAICIPLENNLNYKCECKYPYYGENCQYEIDLCQNITCLNGICYVNESKSP
ncbi:unnamed protein product, partial [Brachionus calyciflorus]